MENAQAVAVIIGIVRGLVLGIEKFTPANWHVSSLLGFVLSIVTGVVLGLFGYFNLTVEGGILAALVATGVYQVGKKIGGQ